jgi:hypothetical protein
LASKRKALLASKTTAIVGLQNDGLVSLENNGLVDEINKYYDHHDGLIAIDKDNYNNDGLVDLDNDNDCLVDPNNDNDSLVSLNRDGLVGYEYEVLIGDVLVSDLSDSEEMGGMPSLPDPDPVRYFLMNHRHYPELQRLGIRNDMSFVPFATRAKSLDEVEYVEIQHFPPRKDNITYKGIFHSNRDERMPAEQSWSKVLKCAVKALGRHGLDEASATKFLMDKTMGANIISFDNLCTWYSNKDTRPLYDAFAKEARPLMTDIFKDLLQACPNIKAVVVHGDEPYKVIVKNGGAVPLELIVNKTHNVAHGGRLSNNAYHSSDWIIYTDVVAEAVAILLDRDAIPLVTTEDRNEILLEPTWNSAEEKAAQKRKRKDGYTAVEKAEEEAQRAVKAAGKTAKQDHKRAEKDAEEKAQRAAKAAAKTAERDPKRAEKEA